MKKLELLNLSHLKSTSQDAPSLEENPIELGRCLEL